MKRILIILFLLYSFAASAQYCGPYTAHSNISESGHSYETIRGDSINCGSSAGIYLYNSHDIHITKCKFVNGTSSAGVGIYLLGCYNITIDSCFFSGTASGCYAQLCTGGIVFQYNHDLNEVGPLPRGQMIQLNTCSGSGNIIQYNISQSFPGVGNYEDHINLYKSNGTSGSYITVKYNTIYGGGPSTTGSGITVADGGGSYQDIEYNTVINPGYIGMQAAGGTYINISNNTIYSKQTTVSHLGLGYGNYSGSPSNNVVMGYNRIKFINSSGSEADTAHHYSAGTYQVSTPINWTTNTVNASIDSTIVSFPLWAACILSPVISYTAPSALTYGSAMATLTPTNTGGIAASFTITPSLPSGLSFNTSTGVFSGTPSAVISATSYTVTATNTAGSGTASVSLTVNKAPLSIYANSLSKVQGTANPTLTASYSGFVLGDTPSSLTTLPTLSTAATTSSPVGTYSITASGAASSNYTISYYSGTLTIYSALLKHHKFKILTH